MYDIVTRKGTYSYLDIESSENWRLSGHESKSNIQILKRGEDEEVEDWLCPQVEQVFIDRRKFGGSKRDDRYRFRGKLYKRMGAFHSCKGRFGKGSSLTAATTASGEALDVPPGLSGILAECLKQSGVNKDKARVANRSLNGGGILSVISTVTGRSRPGAVPNTRPA